MAISRFKTSTLAQGLPKYQKLWDGTSAVFDSDYELIERITVGSGGSSSVTFSSIPQTYRHLQLRAAAKTNRSDNQDIICMRYNSDTGSNYAYHILYGNGSSAGADSNTSTGTPWSGIIAGQTDAANMFGAVITDILDYARTDRYKTMRSLNGTDQNSTAGRIYFSSNLWQSTSAISTLTVTPVYGTSFSQYSNFALYGIKGA